MIKSWERKKLQLIQGNPSSQLPFIHISEQMLFSPPHLASSHLQAVLGLPCLGLKGFVFGCAWVAYVGCSLGMYGETVKVDGLLCTSWKRRRKEKGKERAHNIRWPEDLGKSGNNRFSVAERCSVVTAFNTSGRIFTGELERTQKNHLSCLYCPCSCRGILHGRARSAHAGPAWGSSSCARNESNE